MSYNVNEAIQILSRTPKVVSDLLLGLDDSWLNLRKREDGFTPSEVVGHLISGEQTNWIPRMNIILSNKDDKQFPPFSRDSFDKNLSLRERIDLFSSLRASNIQILQKSVKKSDMIKTGIHPSLGVVTLEQQLSTWVVHDLTHIFQIVEILALRYKETVGPWVDLLKILRL